MKTCGSEIYLNTHKSGNISSHECTTWSNGFMQRQTNNDSFLFIYSVSDINALIQTYCFFTLH